MATTAISGTQAYGKPFLAQAIGNYIDITQGFCLPPSNLRQARDKTHQTAQFPPPFTYNISKKIETLRLKEHARLQQVLQLYQPLKDDTQKRDVFDFCVSIIGVNLFCSAEIPLTDRPGNAPLQQKHGESLLKAECEIGKIIYAAENFTKDTQALIKQNQNSPQVVVKKLEEKIKDQLKAICTSEIEMPKKIAQLILTSKGQLNFGVVELIRLHFFACEFEELQASEWKILQNLAKIDDWRKQFEALDFPQNGISTLQYQREILSLFFDEKSSYTTLEECAHAVFHMHQIKQNQFFETTLNLETPFLLEANGIIRKSGKQFCDCKNLIEACESMGIEDIYTASCKVLNKLFSSSLEPRMVTWKEILKTYEKGDLQKALIVFQQGQKNAPIQLERKKTSSPFLTHPNSVPSEKFRKYGRISSVPAFFQRVLKRLPIFA